MIWKYLLSREEVRVTWRYTHWHHDSSLPLTEERKGENSRAKEVDKDRWEGEREGQFWNDNHNFPNVRLTQEVVLSEMYPKFAKASIQIVGPKNVQHNANGDDCNCQWTVQKGDVLQSIIGTRTLVARVQWDDGKARGWARKSSPVCNLIKNNRQPAGPAAFQCPVCFQQFWSWNTFLLFAFLVFNSMSTSRQYHSPNSWDLT